MRSSLAELARYLGRSNRRIRLDRLLRANRDVYAGKVLDIGSRQRGRFSPPSALVLRWWFCDIAEVHRPDTVSNVACLSFRSGAFDSIKATELFEHVDTPEVGLRECWRVLGDGGVLVLSVPFMYRVHGDPFDFQRWTRSKWEQIFLETGFDVVDAETTGTFFTVSGDMGKAFLRSLPVPLAYPLVLLFQLPLSLLSRLDETRFVLHNPILSSHHSGYFFIVRKRKGA